MIIVTDILYAIGAALAFILHREFAFTRAGWSIGFEPGVPEWSDEERRQSVGYTATYRRVGHNSSNQTIPVDGGPFVDMADAERACHRLWHSIKHAN